MSFIELHIKTEMLLLSNDWKELKLAEKIVEELKLN